MATDVTMPRLSDSMEEGTVLKWLVDEGGEVKRGQPLAEIETDKANMTYEADADGTLIERVAKEGETLAIGEVIARIGEPGERPAEDRGARGPESGEPADEGAGGEPEASEPEAVADQGRAARSGSAAEGADARRGGDASEGDADGRLKASPVARRMARDLGVELAALEGSGPGGRIVKADVEAAAKGGAGVTSEAERGAATLEAEEAPAVEAPAADGGEPAAAEPKPAGEAGPKGELRVQELTTVQRTVSRRMAESKATAPDYQLQVEIDMAGCVELRRRLKEMADPAPSFNDMVVKASANALREFPRVNAAYRDGRFELYSRVNVGIAVAAQDALVVPTIFDADQRSLGDIARTAGELIGKVREGKITPPELSGGTFTISNLGMYGIESFSAVINPPQAALLAVGALKKKPVVDESGRVVARETMAATLVCDHRILYGADGARFLARVRELLEHPLSLSL